MLNIAGKQIYELKDIEIAQSKIKHKKDIKPPK